MKNFFLIIAGTSLGVSIFAQAQQKSIQQPSNSSPPEISSIEPVEVEVQFDVDFIDISVADAFEYISHEIEAESLKPLNIVVSKEASSIVLPTMKLRRITFDQFVAFFNLLGSQGDGSRSDPIFSIVEEQRIWYVSVLVDDQEESGANQMLTRVFPLKNDVENALGLIEEALAESGRHQKKPDPTLKFHEPSQSLIVSGVVSDLQLIEEVCEHFNQKGQQEKQAEVRNKAPSLFQSR